MPMSRVTPLGGLRSRICGNKGRREQRKRNREQTQYRMSLHSLRTARQLMFSTAFV
jgi:hypothetical protein